MRARNRNADRLAAFVAVTLVLAGLAYFAWTVAHTFPAQ